MNFYINKRVAILSLLAGLLSGTVSAQQATVIKVGTLGGAFEQITLAAVKAAEREGSIRIEPVVFNSSVLPNEALAGGDIQANQYQHAVFLANEIKRRGYKIQRVADVYNVPLAIYSKKYKALSELPQGAKFAIPSDEANQDRALHALHDNGLITFKNTFDAAKKSATLQDIQDNPKKLNFIEAQVPAIPKLLDDVDAGAVNASTAFQNSKLTLKDAIALENQSQLDRYPSVLVVREEDRNASWLPTLVQAYKSPEVAALIEQQLSGTIIPLF